MERVLNEQKGNGYTLIEVLIATAVLAIALTGVSSVVIQSNRLNEYNREKKVAQKAANSMMEQIQSKSIDQDQLINFLNSQNEFAVEGLSPVTGNDTVGSLTYEINPDTGDTFPVQVNVILRWDGIMGESKFSLTKVVNKSY